MQLYILSDCLGLNRLYHIKQLNVSKQALIYAPLNPNASSLFAGYLCRPLFIYVAHIISRLEIYDLSVHLFHLVYEYIYIHKLCITYILI